MSRRVEDKGSAWKGPNSNSEGRRDATISTRLVDVYHVFSFSLVPSSGTQQHEQGRADGQTRGEREAIDRNADIGTNLQPVASTPLLLSAASAGLLSTYDGSSIRSHVCLGL